MIKDCTFNRIRKPLVYKTWICCLDNKLHEFLFYIKAKVELGRHLKNSQPYCEASGSSWGVHQPARTQPYTFLLCVGNKVGPKRILEDVNWLRQSGTCGWEKVKKLISCMYMLGRTVEATSCPQGSALCVLHYHSVLHSSTETRDVHRCLFLQQPEPPCHSEGKEQLSMEQPGFCTSEGDDCWLPHYLLQLLSRETLWKKSTTKWNRS